MEHHSALPAVLPEPDPSAGGAEHPGTLPEPVTPKDPQSRSPLHASRSCACRYRHDTCCGDLLPEGANLCALKLRQSRCLTPLSIASRSTQTLLNQF